MCCLLLMLVMVLGVTLTRLVEIRKGLSEMWSSVRVAYETLLRIEGPV